MNILWFNWRDIRNPSAGGAEVYTHEVARRLVALGNNVTLFTSLFKDGSNEEVIDGVRIIRDGNKYTVYLKARIHYSKTFSVDGYDVVVDEINTIPFFTPSFVKQDIRVMSLIHQLAREFWFYETPFPLNYVGYHLEDRWLKLYRDVLTITVSESTRDDLLGLGFHNVSIVHNGINVIPIDDLPLKSDFPVVIWVGRMKYAKKPLDILNAFKLIRKRIPHAELWMVGDGPIRRGLEKSAGPGVKFFGYLNSEARDELVKRAWVIAVPGVREGWGQVVTDANALGTPAVGYNILGLRDSIKHEFSGLLVDINIEALSDAIIKVMLDESLREYLSRNALDWIKKYDWNKTANKFLNIIEGVNIC